MKNVRGAGIEELGGNTSHSFAGLPVLFDGEVHEHLSHCTPYFHIFEITYNLLSHLPQFNKTRNVCSKLIL